MVLDKISIGVDIEEISRFEKYENDPEGDFVKKVYTKNEIEYCFKAKYCAKHLAARFCAKEAIYKALSALGYSEISFQDCEIINLKSGAPTIVFLNDRFKNIKSKISLSHSKTTAIAQVILEVI